MTGGRRVFRRPRAKPAVEETKSMDNAGFVADAVPGRSDTAEVAGQAVAMVAAVAAAASRAASAAEAASIQRRQKKESQLSPACRSVQKEPEQDFRSEQNESQKEPQQAFKSKQKESHNESQQPRRTVQLPRTIGAVSGSAILIGSIVGAGIFISPAEILRHAGSPGAALLIWLACGLVEAVGALCYIELGLLMPEHGGDFVYLLRAFGPLHGFLGAVPAFLQGWLAVNLLFPAGAAALAMTFARYCVGPWYRDPCSPPAGLETLLAVFVILTLTAANCIGVRWATRLQNVSTLAKMSAMAVIVAAGMYYLWQGNAQHLSVGFEGTTKSSGELASAFFTCLYSYIGWKNLNKVTEELKDPPRNLPLSVLSSLSIVTLFYLLVNVAYLAVLSPNQMLSSPAVAFTFGARALGPAAFLMPLGVALSVFGTLNSVAFTSSRVQLAVARRGHHAHVFSLVHVRWLTPVPALMFQAAVACALVLLGDVGALLRLSGFIGTLFNVLVHVALFVLRRTMSDTPRPYRVPTVLAALRLLFSASLLVAPLVQQQPRTEYLYTLLMVVLGLAVYVPCVYRDWSPPLLARGTLGLQKALELLPTE